MTSSYPKHLARRPLTVLALGLALSGAAGATSHASGAYAGTPRGATSVALRAEPLRLAADETTLNARGAPAQQTALVRNCQSAWYWRSLIEEFACGFSGQGWIN